MRVKLRVWLEDETGRQLFGQGLEELLSALCTTGSISAAAKVMDMSYRHAWQKIAKAEERLGYALIARHVGGPGGGGARLTPKGESLLRHFSSLRQQLLSIANQPEH